MVYQIEGIELGGFCEKVGPDLNLEKSLENLGKKGNKPLWKHPNIKMLGIDPTPLALGLIEDSIRTVSKYSNISQNFVLRRHRQFWRG